MDSNINFKEIEDRKAAAKFILSKLERMKCEDEKLDYLENILDYNKYMSSLFNIGYSEPKVTGVKSKEERRDKYKSNNLVKTMLCESEEKSLKTKLTDKELCTKFGIKRTLSIALIKIRPSVPKPKPLTKSHKCDTCKSTFKHKFHLNEHKKNVHGLIKYRCLDVDCDFTFTAPSSLKTHIKNKHQDRFGHCNLKELNLALLKVKIVHYH